MIYLLRILIQISYADKYEKDARKYWDIFYKRHQDKVLTLILFLVYFLQ